MCDYNILLRYILFYLVLISIFFKFVQLFIRHIYLYLAYFMYSSIELLDNGH